MTKRLASMTELRNHMTTSHDLPKESAKAMTPQTLVYVHGKSHQMYQSEMNHDHPGGFKPDA